MYQQRLETLATAIASAVGGSTLKASTTAKRGIYIAATDSERTCGEGTPAMCAMFLLHTDKIFFPLDEDTLEEGGAVWGELPPDARDFPRRLERGLFQYPILVTIASAQTHGTVCVITSPYFALLRDVVTLWQPGRVFSDGLAMDVKEAFKKLRGVTVANGTLSVRAGRMIITGIPFLRSAVFFGENVVESRLYSQLNSAEGVTVEPKDCRLARNYLEPVGDNRRPFVCWFDPHGNFRFTPGSDWQASGCKFLELVSVLSGFGLIRSAETNNPLTKIGWGPSPS
jgi:hypothetical protein